MFSTLFLLTFIASVIYFANAMILVSLRQGVPLNSLYQIELYLSQACYNSYPGLYRPDNEKQSVFRLLFLDHTLGR